MTGSALHVTILIVLTGSSVIIASIFRAFTVKDLSHADASWSNVDPSLWTTAENGVGKSSFELTRVYEKNSDIIS